MFGGESGQNCKIILNNSSTERQLLNFFVLVSNTKILENQDKKPDIIYQLCSWTDLKELFGSIHRPLQVD